MELYHNISNKIEEGEKKYRKIWGEKRKKEKRHRDIQTLREERDNTLSRPPTGVSETQPPEVLIASHRQHPISALAGSWIQESHVGTEPRDSDLGHHLLTSG